MALLDNHLEQIQVSARAIRDLEFPSPKIFTNALLGHHEITTLIRDTEPHERSLFSVNPNVTSDASTRVTRNSSAIGTDTSTRRKTISQIQPKHGSTVARVLGNDMLRQIQQSGRGYGRSRGVDVEVLLRGSEKLCAVYPVAGAKERISKIRSQHAKLADSVKYYEGLVLKQQSKLSRANANKDRDEELNGANMDTLPGQETNNLAEADLHAAEEEIIELEAKKKTLEDRVAGMEKDLGGLRH